MIDTEVRNGGFQLSAESAAYIALAAIAAVLRVANAGWMPLDPFEAGIALPAWQAAHAMPANLIPDAPLLFHLQRLLFWLVGGGDAAARFVAAVAGVGLVLACAGLRPWLGRAGALAAALLLALSPLWVFFGRQVSASTLSACFVLLCLANLLGTSRRNTLTAAAAGALALASGGVAYVALWAGLVILFVHAASGRSGKLTAAVDERLATPADRRTAVYVFLVVLVVAATGLLSRVDGLGALVQALGNWAGRFGQRIGSPVDGFLLPLLVYGPVTSIFGLVGLATLVRRGGALNQFLVLWAVMGLVTGLLVGTPAAVAEALLPLTLAAAVALGALFEDLADGAQWGEEGVMVALVLATLAFGAMRLFAAGNVADPAGLAIDDNIRLAFFSNMRVAFFSILAAFVLIITYWLIWRGRLMWRVLGSSLFIALGLLAWSNGSWLNYRAMTEMREPMRPIYVTPEGASLASNLAMASWAYTRDPDELPAVVDPGLRNALAWLLRTRRDLRWAAPKGAIKEGVAIALHSPVIPAAGAAEFGPAAYKGQTYRVMGSWRAHFDDLHTFLQWLLQRRLGTNMSAAMPMPDFSQADLYIRVSESNQVTPGD